MPGKIIHRTRRRQLRLKAIQDRNARVAKYDAEHGEGAAARADEQYRREMPHYSALRDRMEVEVPPVTGRRRSATKQAWL